MTRADTEKRIFEDTPCFTYGELSCAVGVSAIGEWKRNSRIFGLSYYGKEYYPKYQFDNTIQPLPIIEAVLESLATNDPWLVAAWFHFPNGWIAGPGPEGTVALPPKNCLERTKEIIYAVRNSIGTYFA